MNGKLKKLFQQKVDGKTIIVTGASSGIGLTVSKYLAQAGAHVLLLARTKEKLDEVKAEIEAEGGKASVFPCDLNDMDSIDAVSKEILAAVDHIDILVNNAGRSIRRAVHESIDRFHDFERTMQLNYFGAVRLVLNVLPHMMQRKDGQIINISSIGVLANATRFSAYVASKAALDAFSRCLSAEVHSHKIAITSIYMPLVRTPMIAPTKIYKYVPTLSPEEAADLIAYAIVKRPKKIATNLGRLASITYAVAPDINNILMSIGFNLFPSSTASIGKQEKLNLVQRAYARLFPGEHW
ncbi:MULTISPECIES: SDR family NAD(P)-dependent oxidoreductase [Acinetobacter]|jgi:short-subunit dehydrogenase|uniref:Fatty acyl-CoA reductase n=2 Tax=Acinetobacter venetianus TaxID=52133 RepID=A0A150HPU1_9GAMM|nr:MULTISPECIES: SDR family NAD(P)-dependent oxidoreductase [Acinetobacter]MDA0697829.1 SDR family NAD(P)-dependent oxidoreductase [Pseudomonadota bacterium]ENV38124.1 fatty acyl-CoA reductase [Acinetobacter venetianus RAG-1 = CIP 110063]ERQ00196.1 fatty acyl-CoA reductase [Acinetobacter sp. COS3]KXO80179.1 fatty acyl-CoA reductase [Acinetobacter venetianus]KXO84228.1 fatty acyl-CoA reductase [Acinetobacter venetianus]|tara:strand:+ start:84 stop:971 length:888 start_codon:yes stop_codon:yes gene_type:complete